MWRRHKNGHYQHCIISRENNQHQLTGDMRSPGWGEAKIEHNNSDEYQCEGPSSPRLTSKMLLCAKSIKKLFPDLVGVEEETQLDVSDCSMY